MSSTIVTITGSSAVVYSNGKPKVFAKDNPKYDLILKAYKAGDLDTVADIAFGDELAIAKAYQNGVCIEDGVATIDGESLPVELSNRLVDFAKSGVPMEPLVNLWKRLRENVSFVAVNSLFRLLEHNFHPICPDGRFLAWKAVTKDYKDKWTNKIDNSVGQVVTMARRLVEDNPDNPCGPGLHAGSVEYVRGYQDRSRGDRLIEVAICPSDVVSVPKDSGHQKIRTCKYEVLREVSREDLGLDVESKYGQVYLENVCEDDDELLSDDNFDDEDEEEIDDFDDEDEND